MAIIKIATITNHVRIDQAYLDAASLAGDTLQIEVQNKYLNQVTTMDYPGTLPAQYEDAVKDAIDIATYQSEGDAVVVKAQFNAGTHTLTGSYKRSGEASTGDALGSGELVMLVFTIGHLNATGNELQIGLTLENGVALDTVEVNTLAGYGITVSGTGDDVDISSTVPYKIQCAAPDAAIPQYVILHEYSITDIYS